MISTRPHICSRKRLRLLSMLIFLLLGAAIAAFGQTYDFRQLDKLFTQAAAAIPSGLEVLIVQNGQQVYWKQFGGWPKNRQVAIASATKWYSAGVMMSLVDDRLLSLDDPASKYLPYMTGEKAAITVRQLMSHTAGFPGEFPAADPCLNDSSDTLDHCAQALAKVPLQAPAGTAFIYAGADMQIAGRVAEVAAGKDWQTLFRERIAGPLELSATDYEYRGPTENPRISGGGRSTVSDYMKYLTMIHQRGIHKGRRVLSPQAIHTMLSDQTGGVPIVESPYERIASFHPQAQLNRYGIGNWLEDVNRNDHTHQNSSQGMFGWSPLIDESRNLLVVIGMKNLVTHFEPFYYQMKPMLDNMTPPSRH